MQVLTETQLLERINAFRQRHDDMAPTTFGRNATGEPQLIRSIENGRSPSLSVVNRILDYMARTDAEAATRAKLDAPLGDGPPPEEVEQPLPFSPAPVNPTGASSPTSSSTSSAPPTRSQASGRSLSTGPSQPTVAGCPSCSAPETHETADSSLSVGQPGRSATTTPGAPPAFSQISDAGED